MTDRLHLTADETHLAVRWVSDAADAGACDHALSDRLCDRSIRSKSGRVAVDIAEAQRLVESLVLFTDRLSAAEAALLDKVLPFAYPDMAQTVDPVGTAA